MPQGTLKLRVKTRGFRGSASTGPRPFERVEAGLRRPFADGRGKEVVRRARMGKGGLSTQIARRTHFEPGGGERPWQEPRIRGQALQPDPRHEAIFWNAALGKSAASFQTVGENRVQIGVRDEVVRQQSAALGNGIVSTADYFPFVTGGFGTRTTPARAKAVKPSKSRARFPQAKYAMFWYIALQHKIWLNPRELAEGVLTPPKGLGLNPVMLQALTTYLLKAIVTNLPDGLGRGKAARA